MRFRKSIAAALAIGVLAAASSMANEVVKYAYDARGRVIQVVHTGDVNNGVTVNYTYDEGENRRQVNVSVPN